MNFTINLEVYPYKVLFLIGEKDKKVLKTLKKLKIDKDAYPQLPIDAYAYYKWLGKGYSMIWLPKVPKTAWDISVMQHEILHCTIEILRTTGIPLTETSEEAYTYLQGYITKKVWEKLGFKK